MNVSELPFDEAIATAATGDIWLFRGRSLADRAIQTVTNSPINHVGMAVALDDMPPLLWHAELGRSLPDAWTGERHRGVQLHKLADAVRTWDQKYGQRGWVRRLEGGTIERHHEDRLIETIDKYNGKPFPTTPGLARSWATGRIRRRQASRETIYCAELVAVTLQHMGLLGDKRPMSWYDPGKFWSRRRGRARAAVQARRRDLRAVGMNVGVIGAGLMGATHARLLARSIPGVSVVAICDPAGTPVADELGIATVHADALELIADPAVDAVVVASPAATHEPYALACIAAGKPVLCEKPLATTAAAALRIVEAERAAGRRLVTVGFMRRHDPGYVDLKARLDAGEIGAPLLVHCAHRNVSVHEFFDSAMIITDSAVHEIDVARWLLDDEIARVTVLAPRPSRRAREGLRDPTARAARDRRGTDRRRRGVRQRGLRLRHPLRGRGGGRHARAAPARHGRGPYAAVRAAADR